MAKELVFQTELGFDRNELKFFSNSEVVATTQVNAVKALAIVADGFGIDNMFYKSGTYEDKEGITRPSYTAHGNKVAELISLMKGE